MESVCLCRRSCRHARRKHRTGLSRCWLRQQIIQRNRWRGIRAPVGWPGCCRCVLRVFFRRCHGGAHLPPCHDRTSCGSRWLHHDILRNQLDAQPRRRRHRCKNQLLPDRVAVSADARVAHDLDQQPRVGTDDASLLVRARAHVRVLLNPLLEEQRELLDGLRLAACPLKHTGA